jgi:streptogramin lyase
MSGVTVSATLRDSAVTVSVYTDTSGEYFFPPLRGAGDYSITAQAVGFEIGGSAMQLRPGVQRAEFRLKATDNPLLQLSGWQQLAQLPEETRDQRRAKAMLVRRCTGCHQSSKLFARRFDERGWLGVINLMWRSSGPNALADNARKAELARYLNDTIGPAARPLQVKLPERPAGDSLLPVVYEYRIPDIRGDYAEIGGSNWSDGPPVTMGTGVTIHDATGDLDGNVWFSNPSPLPGRTIGKIDGLTGKTLSFGVPGDKPGSTAKSHGLITGTDGSLWFTAALGDHLGVAHLGYINPRTGEQHVYRVPKELANVGGWLNEDGLGNIWTSAGIYTGNDGVLRFDRKTKQFQQFKSLREGFTYGVAGDAAGNAWWAQIGIDVISYVDASTGKVGQIQLPFTWGSASFLKPGDMEKQEFIEIGGGVGPDAAGVQMPRRIKADLHGDALWVANYAGNNLLRVDTRTRETKFYAAPMPGMATYDVGIDRLHRVWAGLQNGDEVARFDPDSAKWTIYSLPVKGISPRSLVVVERDGQTEVVIPANDANRVMRMIVRTEADVAELRRKHYSRS